MKEARKLPILIENLQKKFAITDNINGLLNRAVETSMQIEGFNIPSEVSITLVDNASIREINKQYRGIDKPTDVLSFPLLEGSNGKLEIKEADYNKDEKLLLLGDIVISLEMAVTQSEEYGHSFERELAFLTTHGMFHLLGYDHEEEDEAKIMFGKQETVLLQMRLQRNTAED